MSNGYLRNLLHYLSGVYDLGGKIKKLRDHRTNPKIATSSIAFTLLIGFMLKIRSFNQLDDWLEHDDFKRIVPRKMRLPRIDVIRDSLKVIELTNIETLHHSIITTSIKNKLVRNGTIDGYKVVIIALHDSSIMYLTIFTHLLLVHMSVKIHTSSLAKKC